MTPGDLNTLARQRYNAVSDDFYSDSEIYSYLWTACKQLATDGQVIERTYTTTTVASQQEYSWPTNAIGIKRITYNGYKIQPITFREDDALTLSNATTTATGTPAYYALWNRTLYLRPVPDSANTLKIFSYNMPQQISATSTLEVPDVFHLDLVEYVLMSMALKDKNYEAASFHQKNWEVVMKAARDWQRKSKRGDAFTAVQDIETLPVTVIGAV